MNHPPGLSAWLQAHPGLGAEALQQARERAGQARARVNRTPEEELLSRGYRVLLRPLGVPGALVRARVDLVGLQVLLDPEGLADLDRRLRESGVAVEARALVLAHELFHVLEPGCPRRLAELAAHLFAGALLGMRHFPGAVDLPATSGPARPGPQEWGAMGPDSALPA